MVCLGCGRWSVAHAGVGSWLCDLCHDGLRRAPARSAGVGVESITVHTGFIHEGAAKELVHHLKFRGMAAAASCMASLLAPHLPASTAWVPIPRAAWRRLSYGVDAAEALAIALARVTGLPMIRGLGAAPFHRPHTGKARIARSAPVFWSRAPLASGAVLVDDVMTSGSTLTAAAQASGARVAVTFTSAPFRPGHDGSLPPRRPPK